MSLVVLIAFGLVYVVPSVMADGDIPDAGKDFFDIGVTIAAGETMVDVSAEDGFQIATGRDRVSRGEVTGPASIITLTFEFSKGTINLHTPRDQETALVAADGGIDLVSSDDSFGIDDIFIEAFDKEKRSLGTLPVADVIAAAVAADTDALTSHSDANNPGRVFLLRIDESQIVNAYTAARGGTFEIFHLSFYVPRANTKIDGNRRIVLPGSWGIKNLALDHVGLDFPQTDDAAKPKSHAHFNKPSNLFTVDLVDDDQGNPRYSRITTNTAVEATAAAGGPPFSATGEVDSANRGSGTPGVVSVTRILERSGFRPIETGPFPVRIILTEEPKGGFTAGLIEVDGGTAGEPVKGLTYKGTAAVPTPAQTSELMPSHVDYYRNDAAVIANDAVADAADEFPEATGRDNRYHEYSVLITPNAGNTDYVTISIKQFADNVLPVPNMYVPLTGPQRNATILTGAALNARDARLKNEALMVKVNTADDTTSKKYLATVAYEARADDDEDDSDGKGKNGIFDLNPNLKSMGKGHVIPANGYLVLAAGKTDSDPISGVQTVSAKLKEKFTAAQQLYNVVYEFKLPFPADDLSNFFRNGGMLQLIHSDIVAATGSGHDEAKASADGDTTHNDYTGYVGATTKQYTAGSVIISEIMWGLDRNSANAQYIELHNTTAADIGIDLSEWAIAVGSGAALGGTVVDTVSNNPPPVAPATSGYWQVPGSDGASTIEPAAGFFTLVDIVSMSRVTGGTDGTAAASWAMSMRASANISGRRIGTPGAANVYVMPAPTPPTPPAPTAPVATGKDIMISEIMVASNGGRLPQWIELANVSGAEVSLMGWSIDIDNDSVDAEVVSEAVNVTLGDVTVGKDEVVLVITKTGRNSGTGMGPDAKGTLREDRIVDVQSQVSATNARYSLISEMAFKITLLPPQKGGIVDRGDVVGNLGMGWELPMSEGGSRSSLIRREMKKAAAAAAATGVAATALSNEIMGTDAAGWVLASETGLAGAYITTYYGHDDDMGTPGYNAGGALPVELSGFNAARDKVTGAVVITWSTQSELNNAGFFIKRGQQKSSQFVVVNPTMIPGAGTTAEKQSYTYTDATADPNVIYYYQIEDVSLDGNRQTLTRAHRLKGHIGAAGKATTTWGELKSSRE